jgi:thioredoxin 1
MQPVDTVAQYADIIQKHTTVVKFTADWCKPCRELSPIFEEMVEVYPHIKFISVDVDAASKKLVKEQEVKSIPMVKFYHNGVLDDQLTIIGFNLVGLTKHVQQLNRLVNTASSSDDDVPLNQSRADIRIEKTKDADSKGPSGSEDSDSEW